MAEFSHRNPFDARGKRLGVFVLAYNAEKLLADTLRRIPEDVWRAVEVVYVVDDCSQDDTTRAALDFPAYRDKLVVFRNRINRRYGGNQKFGYQYAIDRGLDYSDKVKIEYGDKPAPSFEWLRHVKTDAARNALIDYFADKITL